MNLKKHLQDQSWLEALKGEFNKVYFKRIESFIEDQIQKEQIIYPPIDKVFKAFNATPLDKVKVIILGQDPYHRQDQAMGLSFSVPKKIQPPPSLRNIFKELHTDLGIERNNPNLEDWSNQGVLMLNSSLTVTEGLPGSHGNYGWMQFTDYVLRKINETKKNCVFVLWGNYANKKKHLINEKKHCVISSVHPSPLSAYRGFFGSKPFSKINSYLLETNQKPISWA